jgi:hypothetical protein
MEKLSGFIAGIIEGTRPGHYHHTVTTPFLWYPLNEKDARCNDYHGKTRKEWAINHIANKALTEINRDFLDGKKNPLILAIVWEGESEIYQVNYSMGWSMAGRATKIKKIEEVKEAVMGYIRTVAKLVTSLQQQQKLYHELASAIMYKHVLGGSNVDARKETASGELPPAGTGHEGCLCEQSVSSVHESEQA